MDDEATSLNIPSTGVASAPPDRHRISLSSASMSQALQTRERSPPSFKHASQSASNAYPQSTQHPLLTVYVLELEDGYYFVGMTDRDVDESLAAHMAGNECVWTRQVVGFAK